MIYRMFSAVAVALTLSACAIGNEYNYNAANATISAETDKSVTAAVVDQRAYVLSGNKSPNFVGLQRGGFGNPFDVTTQSGRGLAEDLTNVLVRSLEAKGIRTEALVLAPGTSPDDTVARFRRQGTDRLLLVSMREWKTDAMMRLTLHWNLEATVYDAAGTVLGRHAISGTGPVGAAGLESGNSNVAAQQVALKLNELLNAPEIVAALE